MVNLADPQTWNLYAYITDNPTGLTSDRDGEHNPVMWSRFAWRLCPVFFLTAVVFAAPAETRPHKKQKPFNLRVERNVVQVRVVVRNKHGRPIPNLVKGDFLLFDNGKPQVITNFSVENARGAAAPAKNSPGTSVAPPPKSTSIPTRFVGLLFDDMDMKSEQIARVRTAAEHFLDSSLKPGDRVGLFTTSGQDEVGFTADHTKLRKALLRLQPNGLFNKAGNECPDLSDYEAYQIDQLKNHQALAVATQQVVDCKCGGNLRICFGAALAAKTAAREQWSEADSQARYSLRGLEHLVARLSVLPGQRVLVLASPGFLAESERQMISEIIDRAVRAGVVINALDSRGLYTIIPGGGDTHLGPALPLAFQGWMAQIQSASALQDGAVLEELADGTGGVYFHNSNDLDMGFREAGSEPEASYLLAFSPNDLKANGKYHKLKVKLAKGVGRGGWSLQARKGYFAPGSSVTSAQQVKQAINGAVFSQSNQHGLPIQVETKLAQAGSPMSQLTVVTHLNAQALHFVTEGGRSVDTVKFVTVIFDDNGNYVNGKVRTVQFHLGDPLLKQILAQGLAVPMRFQLPPGTYIVRVVVRDGNGTLAATSRTVQAKL